MHTHTVYDFEMYVNITKTIMMKQIVYILAVWSWGSDVTGTWNLIVTIASFIVLIQLLA